MSVRTYLILSYIVLILLLTLGMWFVAHRFMTELTVQTLHIADASVQQVTVANDQLSEKILTNLGEYVVRDKAEDVVRELHYLLGNQKQYDYTQLRRNDKLRRAAVQKIFTPEGAAGYTDLYDNKGEIIFHPDRRAEGQNQLTWRGDYPEATDLLRRSLKEDVSGYFTAFDEHNKDRKRFSVRLHVPNTPFIVSSIVNIDQFFEPTQQKVVQANQQILAQAKHNIQEQFGKLDKQVRMGGWIAGLSLSLIAILFGLWFASTVSRPISRLRDAVRQVGEGNFAVAVSARGVKEVVQLSESFNLLGLQLTDYIEKRDFIRDTFGRYVTQEVVKRLLESKGALEMGGERREVSILMSDLRAFTAITAGMEPEKVITFLNRYLGKMIEILVDYRAVIDEIVGDGILAFFGAPETQEDHPARAVACALQMQTAMEEINALNEADGLPHLEMGIAVNTGEVVVGNIGSEQRTKYSVVGSHVNFTSRIESYALGGEVLISQESYQRVQDLVEIRDKVQVQMKGIPGTSTIYDVRSIHGPYDIALKERSQTLIPLLKKIPVHVYRMSEKIVTGATGQAWITQLSETSAILDYEGELEAWEDVRLNLLEERAGELPGKIYGKVTAIKPIGENLHEAAIRFTSVSPELAQIIQKATPLA
ncbi:MAG: adenylate/guanylate cyclase domain-containing protein [Desulfobaccales bacterium]